MVEQMDFEVQITMSAPSMCLQRSDFRSGLRQTSVTERRAVNKSTADELTDQVDYEGTLFNRPQQFTEENVVVLL